MSPEADRPGADQPGPPPRRRPRRAVRTGTEDAPDESGQPPAWEDDDRAWGEPPTDDVEDRLRRDVPPHWG